MSDNNIVQSRFHMLQAMNDIVVVMNNEYAYLEWIEYVPDEPSTDDLMEIAEKEDEYKGAEELFFEICKRFGGDGLFLG